MSLLDDDSDTSSEAALKKYELIPDTSGMELITESEQPAERELQPSAGNSLQASEEEGEELPSIVDLKAHGAKERRSARLLGEKALSSWWAAPGSYLAGHTEGGVAGGKVSVSRPRVCSCFLLDF